jgi:thymidylate synthase (FAD)
MSARYTQMPNLHYLPDPSRIQVQDKKNKQGSGLSLDYDEAKLILEGLEDDQVRVYNRYETDIEKGVAKEVARINCPVSRYSKMRAKTDLRNWLGFLNLRMRPNAMLEIRQYANTVAGIIEELWPRTYALFEEYTLFAESFSRTEMKVLKDFFAEGGGTSEQLFEVASRHLELKKTRALVNKVRRDPNQG